MATWRKRGKRSWQVRWYEAGIEQFKTVHSVEAREELLREVQRCEDVGERWQPSIVREESDFNALGRAWLLEMSQMQQGSSLALLGHRLNLIERWLRTQQPTGFIRPKALFSKHLVFKMHRELENFEGKVRKEITRTKVARTLVQIWKWATLDSVHRDSVPPLEGVQFKAPPKTRVRAVTWRQLDAVIEQSHGRHRDLLTLIRYTGLRVNQAMRLLWSDVDMKTHVLFIRPELGKTEGERAGRDIPMSQHLVAWLASRGRREGYIVPSGKKQSREGKGRDIWRFWERAEIDPMYWKGRPHHAFRKAIITCLKAQRVDREAIEYYVGHTLPGEVATYTDPWAYELAEVAEAFPEIGKAPEDVRELRRTSAVTERSTSTPAAEIVSIDKVLRKTGGSPGL